MKNGSNILEKAKQEARNILLDAKEEASFCISQINELSKNATANSVKELNSIRNRLNESLKETSSTIFVNEEKQNSVLETDLNIGSKVFISHLGQEGIVMSLPNKSHQVQVQIGSMKMQIPVTRISNIIDTNCTPSSNGATNYKNLTQQHKQSSWEDPREPCCLHNKSNKRKTVTTEINVIGYHVDEAIFVIDKYLDDCALAKLSPVRIVHGKGTGALRKGIHEFLKTNSHVKSFRLGTFGEGEMGVTVVELK